MQKQDVLAAQGLTRVKDDLAAMIVPSIRVTTKPAEVPVGVSHLGGLPDLPEGVSLPQWKDKPLAFVAQFNLAEVHPFDQANLLPSTGMLYFFYDAAGETYGESLKERGGWAVLYHPTDALKRADIAAPFTSCAVEFSNEVTLPLRPEVFGYSSQWTADEHTAYENLTLKMGIQNRLLGHSDAIQDDMHLQAHLLGNDLPLETAPTDENQKAARDWVLLFQCDSDPNAAMRWGNNGRLYYWIHTQALQARDFSHVWMILQSE